MTTQGFLIDARWNSFKPGPNQWERDPFTTYDYTPDAHMIPVGQRLYFLRVMEEPSAKLMTGGGDYLSTSSIAEALAHYIG